MKLNFESGPRTGESITVEPGRSVVVGRDPSADVFIDDSRVSRPHARIWVDAGGAARIEDLKSTNGTFVNGQRVTGTTPLRSGDSVTVGESRIAIVGDAPAGAATVVGTVVTPAPAYVAPAQPQTPAPVAQPAPSSRTSTAVLRRNVASANQTAKVAVGLVAVLIIGIIAVGAWYLLVGRPTPLPELTARLKPSTVLVQVQSDNGGGSGTGWVYDAANKIIVTNNHVIEGGRTVSVSGEGLTPRSANIVAAAPCDDVAVIHVDDNAGMASVKVGSQAALQQGDDVIALGYPGSDSADRNLVYTDGRVSVVKTRIDGFNDIPNLPNVIQHTAIVNTGNSGGPLINRAGEVVGMNTLTNTARDQYYSVGIDRIKEIVDGLAQGKGLGWTGMSMSQPTDEQLAALGLSDYRGLLVTSVVPGTSADQAGLSGGVFLVTAVDGRPVSDAPGYCAAAGSKVSGDKSTFSFVFPDPAGGLPTEIDAELSYN